MKFNKHNVNTYNTSIQTVNLNQDLISKCIILIVLVLNKTFFKNTYYYRSACTVYEQILRQTMDSLLRLKTYMLLFSIMANEKNQKCFEFFICFYMFLYVFICFYMFLYVFICNRNNVFSSYNCAQKTRGARNLQLHQQFC